jgi:tetratricopeptide (TPR) repeat protein
MSLDQATTADLVAPSGFCVPYDQNAHFTGRGSLLERLSLALHDKKPKQYNHRISLHGLGGVGKTQIALAYAYLHKSDYNYVFWISAVDRAQLLSGFGAIANATRCINRASGQSPDEVAKSVLQWLRRAEKCLLVIDNLDDITVVDGYLPSTSGAVHTLITTRNKNSNRIPAEGFEIMTMDPQEAVEFLVNRISLQDTQGSQIQTEAPKIVEELGYLPLAIEQAAAYICESENISEFLTTYKESRQKLLARRPEGNYSYPKTVATTWRMSLQRLETSHPDSIFLLHYLVFLNPDEILVEFLKAGNSGLQAQIEAVIGDNLRFRECLIALQTFSLIRVFAEGEKISIHRLVQAVIQNDLDTDQQAMVLSDIVQLGLQSFPNMSDECKRATCRRYRSQVIVCLGHGDNMKRDSKWLTLAERVAFYLSMDGLYVDGLHWWTLTFDIRKTLLGPEHRDTLESMNGLAWSYRSLGQTKEAAQLYGETLEIRKRVLGPEHRDTLESMNGLAWSYRSLGQTKEAAQLNGETLEIRKRVLGPEHPATLDSINNLAVSYQSLGQTKEAAQLHGETLEIRKRVQGPEHPDTLLSMNNLAVSYQSLGQTKEAAQLHGETLEIRKRVQGPEHPDTLQSMNNLAVSYQRLGQTKEAAQLYGETLEIRKRVLGPKHPDTLQSMNNLASSYRSLGQTEEAAQLEVIPLTGKEATVEEDQDNVDICEHLS